MHLKPSMTAGLMACAITLASFSGCETARHTFYLPYAFPAAKPFAGASTEITLAVGSVTDNRDDHAVDMFLRDYPANFLREALVAELASTGAFAAVASTVESHSSTRYRVDATWREASWATPDRNGVAKTTFGVTLATGGVGGLLYGATGTRVVSRVTVDILVTENATGKVVLVETVQAVHHDSVAKLKVDDLQPRARILATTIREALTKAVGRIQGSLSSDAATG